MKPSDVKADLEQVLDILSEDYSEEYAGDIRWTIQKYQAQYPADKFPKTAVVLKDASDRLNAMWEEHNQDYVPSPE